MEYQEAKYGTVRPDLYPPKSPPAEKAPIILNAFQQQLHDHFERYGLFALFIGIWGTFCFFRNPSGITYPLFIAAAYGGACHFLPSLGIPVKKDSLFLAGAALVLGINSCTTVSPALWHLNLWAQILLGTIFLLHQCYSDQAWNIGKYVNSILRFWLQSLRSLPLPFLHGAEFVKHLKSAKSKNILMALAGILAGIPAVIYLGSLLADADAVFHSILQRLVLNLFNPSTIFTFILMLALFFLGAYCLLGSACAMNIPGECSEKSKRNPMAAISFTFMVALLYLSFCLVQIIYLFGQREGLPGHMTYAQYARQGFFQLLAVAVLNLILVLNCLKFFKSHKVLSCLLVIISICTYIMIASAAYRMLLYVRVYSLTFLRLFVLWFLGLLSLLMLGVLALLFYRTFPLFRWCLVTVTLAYAIFAWSHPDYLIARYNIAQESGWINADNVEYLIGSLSADAAPAIADARIDPEILGRNIYLYHSSKISMPLDGKAQLISCLSGIPWYPGNTGRIPASWHPGIRSYNFSTANAWKLTQTSAYSSK